jgi:hypothetical protein
MVLSEATLGNRLGSEKPAEHMLVGAFRVCDAARTTAFEPTGATSSERGAFKNEEESDAVTTRQDIKKIRANNGGRLVLDSSRF